MLFLSAFGLSLALWAVPGAVTTGALLSRLESLYEHTGARHGCLFHTILLLAAVVWGLFLSGVVLVGRRFVCQQLFRRMNSGCGLVLGYFGRSVLSGLLALLRAYWMVS
jgi:lipid-A-disaccharide synthase-like uncharacterized protein